MTSKIALACTIAALLGAAALAEKPTGKPQPPSKPDQPRPGGAPTPLRVAAPKSTPPPISTPAPKSTPAPPPLVDPAPSDTVKPDGEDKDKDKVPEKKVKGPTIITSVQATFDQKANVAVFLEDVVVVDPEFNIHCDKLTAYLKHDDTAKPAAAPPAKGAKPAATPATTPVAKTETTGDDDAPKKKGSGLEKAIAEASSGKRVLINQDKTEADGTITHGIGRADKAIYDAVTGDVFLYGTPEVIQGPKSVVAIDPDAVITLNRNGSMHTKGMTKTTIDNSGDR